MLFFSGLQEVNFIDTMEKGVKQVIGDKERSKEILTDLKDIKAIFKAFDKDRKVKLKEFHAMNLDRDFLHEDMTEFFDAIMEERVALQEDVTGRRFAVIEKINADEWDKIMELSGELVQLTTDTKTQQDSYAKLTDTIYRVIQENDRQAQAIALAQNFRIRFNDLEKKINSLNSVERKLLTDRQTSREDYTEFMNDMNALRRTAYSGYTDLHFDMLEVTNESEWVKVMGAINKVIE